MATILIAEDEARIANFIAKGLKRAGHRTQVVANGERALALALSERYDLLLLDVGLPGRDGWSVLAELRDRALPIPVIVVTALDGVYERNHSLGLGANEFLSKPFRFQKLLDCVERYV